MTDFFIIGSPRSGGTLLNSVLSSDPEVSPLLMENHFVALAMSVYGTSKSRLGLEKGDFFSDEEDVRVFFAEWVTAFLEKVRARQAPAKHLVIKSVLMSRWAPLLNEVLPDIRFVMSVRDPRDIIVSMIEVGDKQVHSGNQNQFKRDARQLSQDVMDCYMPCLTNQMPGFREKLLLVRYEDLVTDPLKVAAHMEVTTGLNLKGFEPAAGWARNTRDFDKFRRTGAAFATEVSGKGITASRIGRYREKLTTDELETIERLCAPLMQACHYPASV